MPAVVGVRAVDVGPSFDTSDRRALEAHLRDSRRQLADAQALAHVGSWEFTSSASRAIWSSELCRIFGQPQGFAPTLEEFQALVHPEDREAVAGQLDGATGQDRFESSFRIVRPDDQIRHVHGRRYGQVDERGVTHLFGTIQDVTDQRIAEIAGREAQELFETAFSRAPIGMALVGLDGSWMKVNEAVCTMLEWPEEELLKRSFQDITHPDDLDADLAQVELLVAGEITGYEMEKRYITRSGSWIWVHLSVSLVRDAHGRPRHFISQLQDVTQRRHDERRLRAAESDARIQRDHATAIISAMHEGYLLTVDGEIKAVNEALVTLIGFSEQELIGQRPPFPFWPPELRAEIIELRRRVLDTRGGTFEATLMRKDGERFEAEITAHPAVDPAGNVIGFVSTVRDVSVERRQRRELEILARTDSLTGLANRHVLQESLERAAALARRSRRRLALVLLDLDWFKQVNDRYGHPVGDAVLIEVARRLERTVRDGEVVARVGGEEFAWVLPDATAEEAVIAADRARTVIDAVPFDIAGQLTMSAGVSVVEAPASSDELYRLADRALYEAKQTGRNRTCCRIGAESATAPPDEIARRSAPA